MPAPRTSTDQALLSEAILPDLQSLLDTVPVPYHLPLPSTLKYEHGTWVIALPYYQQEYSSPPLWARSILAANQKLDQLASQISPVLALQVSETITKLESAVAEFYQPTIRQFMHESTLAHICQEHSLAVLEASLEVYQIKIGLAERLYQHPTGGHESYHAGALAGTWCSDFNQKGKVIELLTNALNKLKGSAVTPTPCENYKQQTQSINFS